MLPDRDRFLTDVEVTKAADLTEAVGFAGLFLESSNDHHLTEPAAYSSASASRAGLGRLPRAASGGGMGHQALALRA
jgi:hypothetical protein